MLVVIFWFCRLVFLCVFVKLIEIFASSFLFFRTFSSLWPPFVQKVTLWKIPHNRHIKWKAKRCDGHTFDDISKHAQLVL